MSDMCLNFCFVNSWVGVITIGIFWWVSTSQPALLEIYTHKEDELKTSQGALLTASLAYFVLAVLLTILVVFKSIKEQNEVTKNRPIEEENETVTLRASTKRTILTESEFDDSVTHELDD